MSGITGFELRPNPKTHARTIALAAVFLLVAAAGLMYVKWWPYYHKAISSATHHTIGASILGDPGATSGSFTWNDAVHYAMQYFKSVWKAAILGILLGSLVQVLIPDRWLHRALGGNGFKGAFVGGIAALPGMMCTCCAAPIAEGLRRKRVSAGSAVAFWIGNPLLNPATLIFMTFVLSWKFAALRLAFGALLTFGVGYLINRMTKNAELAPTAGIALPQTPSAERPSFWRRWAASMRAMLAHIVPAYLIAVFLLSALKVWLFPIQDGPAMLMLVLFAIVGTLFVIPTAAEIPIIQSFLSLGIGTGPAAALLVTLPAVSLPSLLMVRKSFPRRVLLFLSAAVIAAGIACGLAGSLVL